jgi:hypothetical protein
VTDWRALAAASQARYDAPHGELDERAVVRLGNAAYAAGLSLLMLESPEAAVWLRRAADRWRESWSLGAAVDAWGRPVGVLKATLLADPDDSLDEPAAWALELGTADAPSPIGRYAAVLALLATARLVEARPLADSLRDAEFPADVAGALAALAAADAEALSPELGSVVRSFETRADFLEDVPVADTALVLATLAHRQGLRAELPQSTTLPPAG